MVAPRCYSGLFKKNYRERLYKLGIDFLQEPRREQVARGKEDLPRVIDRDRWILPVSGPADEVAEQDGSASIEDERIGGRVIVIFAVRPAVADNDPLVIDRATLTIGVGFRQRHMPISSCLRVKDGCLAGPIIKTRDLACVNARRGIGRNWRDRAEDTGQRVVVLLAKDVCRAGGE